MTSAVTGVEMGDAYADPETAMPKVVDELCSRPPWEGMMRIHDRTAQAGRVRVRFPPLGLAL